MGAPDFCSTVEPPRLNPAPRLEPWHLRAHLDGGHRSGRAAAGFVVSTVSGYTRDGYTKWRKLLEFGVYLQDRKSTTAEFFTAHLAVHATRALTRGAKRRVEIDPETGLVKPLRVADGGTCTCGWHCAVLP